MIIIIKLIKIKTTFQEGNQSCFMVKVVCRIKIIDHPTDPIKLITPVEN
jgi:hypothetical protein